MFATATMQWLKTEEALFPLHFEQSIISFIDDYYLDLLPEENKSDFEIPKSNSLNLFVVMYFIKLSIFVQAC